MRFLLTVEPLGGAKDKELLQRLMRDLSSIEKREITAHLAAQRLQRALAQNSPSFSRDLLGILFQLAYERGVHPSELFRLEIGSPFELLPPSKTVTYIGGYGNVASDSPRYTETVTTAVWDMRAARRCARRISRDFRKLHYAPPMIGDAVILKETISQEFDLVRSSGQSILSLGSTKSNSFSEFILAEALGCLPFAEYSGAPFVFFFPIPEGTARHRSRCAARFVERHDHSHSYLWWRTGGERQTFKYCPPEDTAPGSLGQDYAVVLTRAIESDRGDILVMGLSGAGTFAAAALLCEFAADFVMPETPAPHVRAFLVEVRVVFGERLREPSEARVLECWTIGGGFEKIDGSWRVLTRG